MSNLTAALPFRADTRLPRHSPGAIALIAGAHAALLALLVMTNVVPLPTNASTLMVDILHPEAPVEKTPERPKPTPVEKKPTPQRQVRPVAQQMLATQADSPAAAAETAIVKDAPTPSPPAPPAVTQPRFDADYLSNPAPTYPPLSRRMGEEGKTILRVHVEPGGRPSQIEVNTSSGSPRLDQAAQEAVWRWKFAPALRGDEAIAAWVLVPIVFTLKN